MSMEVLPRWKPLILLMLSATQHSVHISSCQLWREWSRHGTGQALYIVRPQQTVRGKFYDDFVNEVVS
jgi:hypothetical protein